jgi:hypothetical protein
MALTIAMIATTTNSSISVKPGSRTLRFEAHDLACMPGSMNSRPTLRTPLLKATVDWQFPSVLLPSASP